MLTTTSISARGLGSNTETSRASTGAVALTALLSIVFKQRTCTWLREDVQDDAHSTLYVPQHSTSGSYCEAAHIVSFKHSIGKCCSRGQTPQLCRCDCWNFEERDFRGAIWLFQSSPVSILCFSVIAHLSPLGWAGGSSSPIDQWPCRVYDERGAIRISQQPAVCPNGPLRPYCYGAVTTCVAGGGLISSIRCE